MAALPLKDSQHVVAAIQEKDALGLPADTAFDSVPAWSVSDAGIVAISPAADGLSCDCVPAGLGIATVSFVAVLKGKTFTGSGDLQVLPGDAVSVDMVFGSPQDIQPPASSAV